jgi:hypothetical protein
MSNAANLGTAGISAGSIQENGGAGSYLNNLYKRPLKLPATYQQSTLAG